MLVGPRWSGHIGRATLVGPRWPGRVGRATLALAAWNSRRGAAVVEQPRGTAVVERTKYKHTPGRATKAAPTKCLLQKSNK